MINDILRFETCWVVKIKLYYVIIWLYYYYYYY
jgi:hypothetical protein